MKINQVIFGIVIVSIMSAVWNSNWFQKEFYPKEYWSKQVTLFENAVTMDRHTIQDSIIELKKLQMTASLQIEQEVNSAESLGISRAEAAKETAEMIEMEAQYLREDIVFWKDFLSKDEEKLKTAQNLLSRYQ